MIGLKGGALLAAISLLASSGAFEARAADPPEPVAVEWRADATLRGRVLDTAGAPLKGAQVRAQRTRFADAVGRPADPADAGAASWTRGAGGTTTDAKGAFEIRGLETDVYSVQVLTTSGATVTFAGGVAAPRGGPPVLYVVPPAGDPVEGDLRDADGGPMGDAIVTVSPFGDGWTSASAEDETDGTGRFRVEGCPRPSGSEADPGFWLNFRNADGTRWGRNAMHVDPARRALLYCRGPAEMVGTVTDARGAPVAGARVVAEMVGGRMPRFGDADSLADPEGRTGVWLSAATTTDARGGYRFTRLLEALVSKVLVTASGFAPLLIEHGPPRNTKSMHPSVMAEETKFLTRRGEPVRIDAVLRAGRTVSGRCLDASGAPVSHARLALCARGIWTFVAGATGEDGTFRLSGMPAENLQWVDRPAALLLLDAPGWDFADGGDFDIAMPRGTGPTYRKEVRLARVASISGRVVDAAGTPVAEGWVAVERTDGHKLRGMTSAVLTGVDGTFVVPNLLPGPYRLISSHSAMKQTAKALVNAPSDEGDVTGVTIRFDSALPPAPEGK